MRILVNRYSLLAARFSLLNIGFWRKDGKIMDDFGPIVRSVLRRISRPEVDIFIGYVVY
jgi:hypothetical protein